MAQISDAAMRARPKATSRWVIESGARGEGCLVGRITPAGARTFYYRYTDSTGERVRLAIGPYDARGDGKSAFTVQQARDKARDLTALYRDGVHDLREHFQRIKEDERRAEEAARLAVVEAQREAREAAAAAERRVTVKQLFDRWQRVELAPHLLADGTRTGRKDGGEWVRQSFVRRVFPKLGDVHAEDATRADLLAILDDAKSDGRRRTANVLLADLRQMFRFAADREIVQRNPLEGVKRARVGGKDVERERALSDDELRALARAVPKARLAPRSAVAIWLILATGARVGELMAARWEHVNIDARTWYLPTTKNQREHLIHLSDFALRQFAALAELREIGVDGQPVPWLFPATDCTAHVCIKSFGKQLADRQREPAARLSNRTKATSSLAMPGGQWTAHDLRRTTATLMARRRVSTDVIDECLNHKLQSKVARTYVRDRRLPEQARAFDALGRRLDELTGGDAASNVVPIKGAA